MLHQAIRDIQHAPAALLVQCGTLLVSLCKVWCDRTVFTTLYMLLEHGHDSPQRVARLDPPTNVFRLRLVCQVCLSSQAWGQQGRGRAACYFAAMSVQCLEHGSAQLQSNACCCLPQRAVISKAVQHILRTHRVSLTCVAAEQVLEVCGQYFCKGQNGRRLDRLLAFLHRYLLAKASLPLDIDLDIQVLPPFAASAWVTQCSQHKNPCQVHADAVTAGCTLTWPGGCHLIRSSECTAQLSAVPTTSSLDPSASSGR